MQHTKFKKQNGPCNFQKVKNVQILTHDARHKRKPLAIAHLSDLFNLQNYLKLQKLEICWKRVIKKVIHIVEIYFKKRS